MLDLIKPFQRVKPWDEVDSVLSGESKEQRATLKLVYRHSETKEECSLTFSVPTSNLFPPGKMAWETKAWHCNRTDGTALVTFVRGEARCVMMTTINDLLNQSALAEAAAAKSKKVIQTNTPSDR